MSSSPAAPPPPATRAEQLWLGVALGLGALAGLAYLGVGLHFAPDGGLSVPLRDSYLFHQYAASLAQGHPYAFMPGDPPSTGSTSHLYPALLAVFYALGARGDALSVAGGLASLAALLASLALLWAIARRIAPRALPLAVVLCATSGHLASTLFAQTDATLAVPLALGVFAALLHGRAVALGAAAAGLSLARPDGGIVAAALLLASLGRGRAAVPRRALRIAGGLGLAAFAATLVANRLLTDTWVPQAVEAKGLFHHYSPIGALHRASDQLGALFVELFLGLGDGARRMVLLPVLGGLLAAAGFLARAREGALFERFWLLAALGIAAAGVLVGDAGVHRDRYLAWVLPGALVYAAAGAHAAAERVRAAALGPGLAVGLVGFQLVGAAWFWSAFASDSASTASHVRFAKELARTLPPGTRLGMTDSAGLAYFLPGHHVTNVHGIVSPAFAYPDPNVTFVEVLRERPELRFDRWLLQASAITRWGARPFLGPMVASESPEVNGGDVFVLFEADWGPLEPPGPSPGPDAPRPLDRLEVGLPASEAGHAYRVRSRVPGARVEPTLVTGRLDGKEVCDVGRVVLGGESFRLRAPPSGRGVLVLRTAWRADALVRNAASVAGRRFHMEAPLALEVRVDGAPVATPRLPLEPAPDRIQELALDLPAPGDAGTGRDWIDVEIDGDYVSLGYRFYDAETLPASAAGHDVGRTR